MWQAEPARSLVTTARLHHNIQYLPPTRTCPTRGAVSAARIYDAPGTYTVAVKVVDVFGIDSAKRLEVTV